MLIFMFCQPAGSVRQFFFIPPQGNQQTRRGEQWRSEMSIEVSIEMF